MSPIVAALILQVAASLHGYRDLHEKGAIVYELGGEQHIERSSSTALAQLHFEQPPAGAKIEAMIHTHYHDCRFSAADIDLANRLDIPSYILCDDQLSVYVPGVTPVRIAPPEGNQPLPYRYAIGAEVDSEGMPVPDHAAPHMTLAPSATPHLCGSQFTYGPCGR